MFKKDEILGFETDTVWGMGCHPLNDKAVEKIYEFKSRDKSKPLILMSSDIKNILPYIKTIPDYAKILAEKYFPGGLTLIFEKTHLCPDFVTSNFNTVGIRIPNHKGFHSVAENFEGKVLATTSLNFSNLPPVKNYEEAVEKFGKEIRIIKPENNNESPSGTASTVVLCTGEKPVVLRQGDIII